MPESEIEILLRHETEIIHATAFEILLLTGSEKCLKCETEDMLAM